MILMQMADSDSYFRMYYGPELVADAVQSWLKEKHVDTHYIEPGSPWQNPYSESFNSIFRTT